jgi:hypothetical protein
MNHRTIWKKHFGEIPKDSDGRPFEIHHINGDHKDNRIENLKCVAIKEHYDIHYNNGDYGACVMIAKRMNLSVDFISQIQKGVKRPGVGGVKKGNIPWNKNKKGYMLHSKETKSLLSEKSSGENNPKSKLTEMDVKNIIDSYLKRPNVPDVGKIMRNGVEMSYDRSFSIQYSKMYDISPENVERIIKRKSWKNVWIK